MLLLRLFRRDDPSDQIDVRTLTEGELKVGRDPGDGWALRDADRQVSRVHAVLRLVGGVLAVTDQSSNGTFLGDERIERGASTPVEPGESLRMGALVIVVERAPAGARADSASPFDRRAVDGPRLDDVSPFRAPSGMDPPPAGGERRRQDPFGSGLEADPLLPVTSQPLAPPGFDDDAWDRRRAPRADDWDSAPAAARHAGHENLIGKDHRWTEPPEPAPQEAGFGFDAPFTRPVLRAPDPRPGETDIPSDWDSPPPDPAGAASPAFPPPPQPEPAEAQEPAPPPPVPPRAPPTSVPGPDANADAAQALVEAFCAGARLDARSLSGEDPAELMRRLGGLYQQMVLGLADLMGDRTSVKNEYRMTRTLMNAEGNNPFKWSPAQRVAVELLRSGGEGFMTGPAAVKASFEDLKKHLLCMLAGLRAAMNATLDGLSPETIDAELSGRSYLIKAQRDAAAWAEFVRVHAAFRQQADDNPDGDVNRAFRAAYERQLQELDSSTPRR